MSSSGDDHRDPKSTRLVMTRRGSTNQNEEEGKNNKPKSPKENEQQQESSNNKTKKYDDKKDAKSSMRKKKVATASTIKRSACTPMGGYDGGGGGGGATSNAAAPAALVAVLDSAQERAIDIALTSSDHDKLLNDDDNDEIHERSGAVVVVDVDDLMEQKLRGASNNINTNGGHQYQRRRHRTAASEPSPPPPPPPPARISDWNSQKGGGRNAPAGAASFLDRFSNEDNKILAYLSSASFGAASSSAGSEGDADNDDLDSFNNSDAKIRPSVDIHQYASHIQAHPQEREQLQSQQQQIRPGAYHKTPGEDAERRRTFHPDQLLSASTTTDSDSDLDPLEEEDESVNSYRFQDEPTTPTSSRQQGMEEERIVPATPSEPNNNNNNNNNHISSNTGRISSGFSGLVEAHPLSERHLHVGIASPAENVQKMEEERRQQIQKRRKQFHQNLTICWGPLLLMIVLLGIALAIVFATSSSTSSSMSSSVEDNNNNSNNNTSSTSTPTTIAPTMSFQIDLPDYTIETLLADQNGTSPQSRAYQWVIQHPKFNHFSMNQLQQKFALATFYFATHGEKWNQGSNPNIVVADADGGDKFHFHTHTSDYDSLKMGCGVRRPPAGPPPPPREIPGLLPPQLPPATGNVTITNTANWLDYQVDECLWFNRNTGQHVPVETCNHKGYYTYLYLDKNNLHGTICPQLALLTNLMGLGLRFNDLFGTIPLELFQNNAISITEGGNSATTMTSAMTGMLDFNLERNHLTGSIPSQLGRWTNLRDLILERNELEGTLPSELFRLTKLNDIKIGGNSLRGSIGSEIGTAFSDLIKLDLRGNCFSSTLPTEIGLLSELRILDIYYNRFVGTIPSQLGLASKLFSVQLQANDLESSLPSQLGQLQAMEVFAIQHNPKLNGTIPIEMASLAVSSGLPIPPYLLPPPPGGPGAFMTNAQNNNNFELVASPPTASPTAMPRASAEELGKLIHLQVFDIRSTSISGPIPTEYCNTTTMEELLFDCSSTTPPTILCGCNDCPCL